MNFEEWFEKKLAVDRYPLPKEILSFNYDIIINVSDEYITYCHDAATKAEIMYFWFPISECVGDMGLGNIYAALQILDMAEKNNKKVLLHCHAGVNRSPTIADCFYFMKTGKHAERFSIDLELHRKTGEIKKEKVEKNRLQENSELGHLPPLEKMEAFLKNCQVWFNKEETMRGGGLDSCKYLSNIS